MSIEQSLKDAISIIEDANVTIIILNNEVTRLANLAEKQRQELAKLHAINNAQLN